MCHHLHKMLQRWHVIQVTPTVKMQTLAEFHAIQWSLGETKYTEGKLCQ